MRSLALSLPALGLALSCANSSVVTSPPPAPVEPPASGAFQSGATRLWQENCANCHGERGEGGGAGTRTLLIADLFDQKHDRRFFDATKNGVPEAGMAAFGRTMTDQQIWALVVHIRELQKRALLKEMVPRESNGVFSTKYHSYRVETVVDVGTLRTPWAVDWLPDGSMIVTNRPGPVLLFQKGATTPLDIEGVPPTVEVGQGGMMDVAVHPKYAQNGWVYLAFADPLRPGSRESMTKLVRGKIAVADGRARWTSQQTIFELPRQTYTGSGVHFGCRIVFDGKGHIFFPIGERGAAHMSPDLTKPNGKVYRLREDGAVPPDNPFATARDRAAGRIGAIWSYGHRNPQGLVFDLNGVLWDTEHGPRGGDELNRVEKGKNYGWPVVSFGINYSDEPFVTPWPQPEHNITQPVFRWLPSIGACGLDVYRAGPFSRWRGDLLAGGLSGQNLDRIRSRNGSVSEHENLLYGRGRVRDVQVGPDGLIYVVLNGPDKIVRLRPS